MGKARRRLQVGLQICKAFEGIRRQALKSGIHE
jgi:hypothetical protein